MEREYAGGLIGRKAKNFKGVFAIFVLHLCLSFHFVCLSFPASQNKKKSADKLSEQQIFIKTKNQGYTLNLSSILYIKNRGKKVEIHTTDMEEIIGVYATMDELEGQLGAAFTAATVLYGVLRLGAVQWRIRQTKIPQDRACQHQKHGGEVS